MTVPAPAAGRGRAPSALRSVPALLCLCLVLAGCGVGDRDAPSGAPGTPPGPVPSPDAQAVCLQGEPFVAQGPLELSPGAAVAEGARIAALRWQAHEGCERFVVDLDATGGVGAVTAELLRDRALLRLTLRDVREVSPDATDAHPGGALAASAYAVWSHERVGSVVDLHLAGPAEAHVLLLESPARVVVDLRPGGGAMGQGATRGQRVVVLDPRPGTATYPFTVSGYSRTFEANVVVRIEQDGREVFETFTTAAGWIDTWGSFTLTVPDGPSGAITVHVGEYSARDGAWEGVAIDLRMP